MGYITLLLASLVLSALLYVIGVWVMGLPLRKKDTDSVAGVVMPNLKKMDKSDTSAPMRYKELKGEEYTLYQGNAVVNNETKAIYAPYNKAKLEKYDV